MCFDTAVELLGADVAGQARDSDLAGGRKCADWAREGGIIIAETKFELGWIEGELAICDEVLTPDSSRFWPAADWKPGTTPSSFDKQPLRDWLAAVDGWDKAPPPPPLPDHLVEATAARYRDAYERIRGPSLADCPRGARPPRPGIPLPPPSKGQ